MPFDKKVKIAGIVLEKLTLGKKEWLTIRLDNNQVITINKNLCEIVQPKTKHGPWVAVPPNQGTEEPAWVDLCRPDEESDFNIANVYAGEGRTAFENAQLLADALNAKYEKNI